MPNKKDKLNPLKMAAEYGFALAFLNSDPEIKKLFKQAVKHTWTPDMFTARLRNTKWFKTHSAPVRNAIMQKAADPKTYRENVNKMYSQVKDAWGKAYGAGGISDGQLLKMAETAFTFGWSEEQLLDRMGASVNFQQLLSSQNLGGTAAETKMQMDELAAQFGVDPGGNWRAQNLKRVMLGDDTVSGIQERIKDMAKAQYAAVADQIDAGRTVMEIADPYVQKMADLLELNPTDVGLKDSSIQRALTQARDKDGNPMLQNINDFANDVRKDTRWQYTANAKQSVANTTSQLLRSFGLMAN